MPPMCTAVRRRASVTCSPRSRARLIPVPTRRRLMAKPCTPHLHCAARATLRAKSLQCKPFSGGSKGGVLFCEREHPLCPVQRQRRCNLPRPWQGKRKSTTTFVVMLYGAGDEARTRFPASREPPYGDSQEPCLTSDLMRLRRGWRQRVLSA